MCQHGQHRGLMDLNSTPKLKVLGRKRIIVVLVYVGRGKVILKMIIMAY